ncbi:MAG: hypothetical protein GY757_59725 [bacterium]|nr:hypothetical protein [bacterium]
MTLDIDKIFLYRAVEENVNLSVYFAVDENRAYNYLSRFLKINEAGQFVIIDTPTGAHGGTKQLVPNDDISILFKLSGFRFLFDTKVLEKTEFQLNENTNVNGLKVRMPTKLLDGNRRQFFRVIVPVNKPIKIHYTVMGRSSVKGNLASFEKAGSGASFLEAVMIDISGGGLAIKSDRKLNIKQGDKLLMRFKLADFEREEIHVEGVVRSTREYAEKKDTLWGIEFMPQKDIKFKRAMNRINKFVMEGQRKFINKLK